MLKSNGLAKTRIQRGHSAPLNPLTLSPGAAKALNKTPQRRVITKPASESLYYPDEHTGDL